MRSAEALLDDALATLVLGCDAVGIAPENWQSPIVGTFDPDVTDGYVGKVHAHDEQPPADPPEYLYDLPLRTHPLENRDLAALSYTAALVAAGWEPFSDFAHGEGENYRRTVYFTRPDGARTGMTFGPNGTFQTYESPLTTDARVMRPSAGETPAWRG